MAPLRRIQRLCSDHPRELLSDDGEVGALLRPVRQASGGVKRTLWGVAIESGEESVGPIKQS
jgi:hypothetical protein